MKLIQLSTIEAMQDEGRRLQNALESLEFIQEFVQRRNARVYSMRDAQGVSVLCLSVKPDNECEHVVGFNNRRPSEGELALLKPLLEAEGIRLNYKSGTIC